MTKQVVSLTDRFEQRSGQVLLSGMQTLVRLPLDQARRDRAAGRRSAGYITGYRGSPITTLDAQLWAAGDLLDAHDIRFEPGLNEELAATSLRGTQQLDWFGPSPFEGVFAMWYAKGLGVDRACEALKLANFEGTAAHGGVLVVAGDDHGGKSSASAHQSDHTLIAGFIPVLAPSTTEEILEFGAMGWELSRFSGLYVGLKAVTDMLDLTASVTLREPTLVRPERREQLNLQRGSPPLRQEDLVLNHRLPAALAFIRANGLNRVVVPADRPLLAIVSAGKAWLDLRQALLDLGLDDVRCAALGITLVKFGAIWPLDPGFAREACGGAREVLVIEEKRPVIEEQLTGALYPLSDSRPTVLGKRDEQGRTLLPLDGVIDPAMVRRVLQQRFHRLGISDAELEARAAHWRTLDAAHRDAAIAIRPAFFCSGCPHNTSTLLPDGSFAMGATGCHGLAAFMPERRTMNVVGMGAEGLPWIGAQHFVETSHVFANMGDGTFTHSGILAIRAAVAANARMTFKILFNDAVAMTGGQPMEGGTSVPMIVAALIAEKVAPVVVLSDDPTRWAGKLPPSVRIGHRDELDQVQRELRGRAQVSAIVYEQTCANENRRRRKRGIAIDPDMRLFINAAICEGCGDCSVQSNCVSVQPLQTEFGRKRRIDQSTCNKDFSCIKGFCPSFVSVTGARVARRGADSAVLEPLVARLPEPPLANVSGGYSLLICGIGGTGVLTLGALLAMAAHIEGKAVKVLDMTGMAQKGGGVTSHVRFASKACAIPSARLGFGQADAVIAGDLVVGTAPEALATLHNGSIVVANRDVVPTGEFQTRHDLDLRPERFLPAFERRIAAGNLAQLEANTIARAAFGDTIFSNPLLLGYAAQAGLLPVAPAALEQAICLNGTAAETNLAAFALGRVAQAFPDELAAVLPIAPTQRVPQTLEAMLESRTSLLAAYQNGAYAASYKEFVSQIAERLRQRDVGECERFLTAVAEQLARLMSYKDEYEVARLYVRPEFRAEFDAEFDGKPRLAVNLAPPLLAWRKDVKTGSPRKIALGPWVFGAFRLLAWLKRLRGTPLDVFGYTAERRMERALIGEYRALIGALAERITDETAELATEIAASAALIAGFGPVKARGVAAFRSRVIEMEDRLAAALRAQTEGSPVAADAA
ncbi:indolepyruvate ferredoxin oxidoreductase family protein [Sphingomonas tabacisoli]|uniref:Indolepyruvate ferredoxin oxidoreductase family protein n=1 Tax=Sphingomonas tabacisoli TaxID=2249466 RepID=A0ABW4I245_9SPHN